MSLLDTPLRKSLTDQSVHLRAALKDFERDFFGSHNRRPSRDDIKQNDEVAAKYKQYSKLRDVLSGKLSKAALEENGSPTRQRRRKIAAEVSSTPRKTRSAATPRKVLGQIRPDELDPYDTPSSVAPRPQITALGPTPQRDGRVMGIFDMLEASGSRTRSSKKRKLSNLLQDEALEEGSAAKNPAGSQDTLTAAAQTPARPRSKVGSRSGDVLDHLAGTPVTGRHNKHSRTPASEGRKFMLNQFFATPTAIRYASMLKDPGADELLDGPAMLTGTPETKPAATPLLDRVLGRTPVQTKDPNSNVDTETPAEGEKTPAYLKRSHSFKQRLLSASTLGSRAQKSSDGDTDALRTSRPAQRSGPRHLIKSRFNPRPLSQIAQQLKDRETGEALQHAHTAERLAAEAAADDDELDALREIEVNDNIIVDESQTKDNPNTRSNESIDGVEAQPARKWKKKGQKRTTRRAIMRPSKVKVQDPKYRHETPDSELEDEDDSPAADKEPEVDPQDQVEETQLQPSTAAISNETFSDDELLAEIFANSDDELFGVRPVGKSPAGSRRVRQRGLDTQIHDFEADAGADAHAQDSQDEDDEANDDDDDDDDENDQDFTHDHPEVNDDEISIRRPPPPPPPLKTSKPKPKPKATISKPKPKPTTVRRDTGDVSPPARKINPNAQSHMNFRTLKIRNKNSKAKGRVRFGRR